MFIVNKKDRLNPVFLLAVMSASRRLDWKKLRKIIGTKRLTFAPLDDVKSLTGCLNGAVPPFGSLFNTKTYMDHSLTE